MKKALICLFLSIIMIFSGCVNQPEYFKEKITISLTPYDMPTAQQKWVTLYYPNSDYSDVLAFSQQINASGNAYEEIMHALLSGTESGYVSPFPQGISCRGIMLVQDILYIDMSWQFNQIPREQFFSCISVLASTFASLSEVSFVNITVEGKQITLPEMPDHPIMLLSPYTGTISALNSLYLRHSDQQNTAILESFYSAIYVADETNKYILPKTSSITVRDGNYGAAITSALLAESTAIFPNGFMLSGVPRYDGKTETINIDLVCPDQWNYTDGWLGPYALMSTLNSLYSKANTLNLTIVDSQGVQKVFLSEKTADCFSKIKSVVEVLTPDISGERPVRTNILVSIMPGSGNIKGFINEYLCTINPAFRNSGTIVNSVVISNDTVIIDLSSEYFRYYEKSVSSAESEYALVYSIVFVACTYTGTAKALLLQDGQKRSTVAGYIKIDQPLLNLPSEYVNSIP